MNVPDGVTVTEEWAVHSEDGNIYRVDGDHRETAEKEAALLQRSVDGEAGEPQASPASRWVMIAPDGRVASTGWRWTLGWKPAVS